MIVFYHLGGIDYGTIEPGEFFTPNLNKFFSAFCSAGVPLFFMVNGALVNQKKTHWKQMLSKACHLLFLLVFWKFVLQYIISIQLLKIREDMVHFWFLGTLSIVYIVSIAIEKLNRLRNFVLIFLFLFPFLYNFLWDVYLFVFPSFDSFKFTHTGFYTLYTILYYYLGDYLREHQISHYYSLGLIIVGLFLVNFEVVAMSNHFRAIYDGVNSSFPTFGAMAMSIGIFLFFKGKISRNGIIKKLILFVGRNTMGIYLYHVLLIIMLRRFIPELLLVSNPLATLLISSIIILITAFISNVFSNSKVAFLVNLSSKPSSPKFHS